MPITALYASLLALLLVGLSLRIVGIRRRHRIAFGDGGNQELLQTIRAHGNLAEFAPMVLILLWLSETGGLPHWYVHGAGVLIVVARVLQASGLLTKKQPNIGRVVGTAGTFGILITLALVLIGRSVIG